MNKENFGRRGVWSEVEYEPDAPYPIGTKLFRTVIIAYNIILYNR